ncbi:hypothetical protein J7E73_10240 [Paenibacillus albidus]|uniref:hypothetical protein n=1 Tax=Paenibacillus albidus TaxID=2041023 RepID=UPI001BE5ECD8|nr:hypothetical protein [Paenibacillus albidus]MBT2289504.1 hypothetical protein [Paenibacillus albidus]
MLNVSFKARAAQPSEKAIIINQIQSGLFAVPSYLIFQANPSPMSAPQYLKTEVALPVPYKPTSMEDTMNYVSQLEKAHGVEPGNVVVVGEFCLSDLYDRDVLINRSHPEMLAAAFEQSIDDEDSLFELIERFEPGEIEAKIQSHLSPIYSVSMNAKKETPWPLKQQLFMPHYEILLPVQSQTVSLEDLCSRISQEFDALSSETVGDQMRFYCAAEEGQYVSTVLDVVYIVDKMYGPDIRLRLAHQGIIGASICFHIDVLYC